MAYERKEIDRKEVLTLLGRMYALTATGKGRIGLCRYIRKEGGPTQRRKGMETQFDFPCGAN